MTTKDQLTLIVEKIERLEDERRDIADLIKDAYAEAKGNGFDTTALRKVIAMRRKDADQRAEEEAMLEAYMAALGML